MEGDRSSVRIPVRVGEATNNPGNFDWSASHMAKRIPMKEVDRSSITGRFVTERYAEKHPNTTEHEHVPISNPKK
jgi:hypothetical protein